MFDKTQKGQLLLNVNVYLALLYPNFMSLNVAKENFIIKYKKMSFYNTLKKDINTVLKKDILKNDYKKEVLDMFQVSEPPKDKFGDVSTNAAFHYINYRKQTPKVLLICL